MPISDLHDVRTVVLDGSGNGVVSFGPSRPNTKWTIQRASVLVSSNTLEPTAYIRRDSVNGPLITSTFSGSQDTDSDIDDRPLYPGQLYVCQWLNGDAGATATISYSGIEESS